jgi:GDP-mannose 6-dehydrogenase
MKIGVFGLGYVGCVSAACLADSGHTVIGVDINPVKVGVLNEGRTPIIESEIEEIIARGRKSGRLRATGDMAEAVRVADLSVVCVGTPSRPNGSLDLTYVERVCGEIGSLLPGRERRHIVVIRSTILPGTMRSLVIPTLERASGARAGKDFGVCFNPEFLREGTSVFDYYHPPKIIVGSASPEDAATVMAMYDGIEAARFVTELEVSEMVKYADNTFHGLKVCFANEIGNICKELGIDSGRVMDIFVSDTKLNVSRNYLKPGFAFGGSCLPKDLRALTYKATALDLKVPVLSAILESNEYHLGRAARMVMDAGSKRVGILGLSFKEGTDDMRESPVVSLIETLIGKGYELKIYDRNVNLARLVGANREYIEKHIRHISRLMTEDVGELAAFADIIVVGNKSEEFKGIVEALDEKHTVIDLVRLADRVETKARYVGLCW